MTTERSRREAKRQQTRRTILEPARRLFAEQGFEATTVGDVAEAADVAVQTVFNHAPTKEALFFLDRVPFAEALAAELDPAEGQSWTDALVAHLTGLTIGYLRSLDDPERLDMAAQIERTPSLARYERVLHSEAERALGVSSSAHLPGTNGPLAAATSLATTRVNAHAHRQRLIAGVAAPASLDELARQLPRYLTSTLAAAALSPDTPG